MDEITLWNHADKQEGVVKTKSWGACTSDTCAHVSHDPYFEYKVTEIEGEVLWEGEQGEKLVKSEKGRFFYTRYQSQGHYAPAMCTYELKVSKGKPMLPEKVWKALLSRYESARHIVLQDLLKVAEAPPL